MAIDFSNYINTYKGSPVLQQQFPNVNDYLALFGYQPEGINPPSNNLPITKPIQPPSGPVSIIGQDLRSGAGSAGIPSIGSGAGQGSGLIGDFMTATQERQNRLTNPNKVQSFINQFTGGGQRDIGEMIRTGQVDTRASAGLPLGIGAGIAMMLPDNYYNMSLGDQVFTQSQMGYTGPTVFGENTTGGAKDPFGLNVRSGFGNYAEAVGKDFASLRESLTGRLSDKYGVEFDEETGMFVGANAKTANDMTKMMRTRFNFRKQQLDAKNRLDAQIKAAEEKRKAKAEEEMKARQADTTRRARELNPGVYARAEQLGFIDKDTGGFKSTGTNENFSNKTGKGRTGYEKGGRIGFRGGGSYQGVGGYGRGRSTSSSGPAGGASAGGNYGGNRNPQQTYGGSIFTGGGGGGRKTTTPTINPFSRKNLQTHFANNQLLKNAVAKGLLTNKEYNILGGYDATQTLGLGPIDTGLASFGYNVVQSILGNQPFSDIVGDVARNVKGATNISPELQSKYENIIGQNLASGGRVGFKKGGLATMFKLKG